MGKQCKVCSLPPDKKKIVDQMIYEGRRDTDIANFMGDTHRTAVLRHRRDHVVPEMRHLAAIADRGRAVREQREATLAAQADDPLAYISLAQILSDLRAVSDRLNRDAEAASASGQRMAVASLSTAQISAIAERGKLGQHGGYAPRANTAVDAPQVFSLTISFGGSGRSETLTMSPAEPVVDAVPFAPTAIAIEPGVSEDLPVTRLGGSATQSVRRNPFIIDDEDDDAGC